VDMFGGFEFAGDMGALDFIASQMGVSKETIEELRRISSLSDEELNAELNPLFEKILVKGEGLTHQEIAGRLGVPVGTVKSRSHRAHRRLVELLDHMREGGTA